MNWWKKERNIEREKEVKIERKKKDEWKEKLWLVETKKGRMDEKGGRRMEVKKQKTMN